MPVDVYTAPVAIYTARVALTKRNFYDTTKEFFMMPQRNHLFEHKNENCII